MRFQITSRDVRHLAPETTLVALRHSATMPFMSAAAVRIFEEVEPRSF